MAPTAGNVHQAPYRRTGLILPGLLGLIALLAGGIALVIHFVANGDDVLAGIFGMTGLFLVAVVCLAIAGERVNSWTIEADGIRILERPRVRLFGARRQAFVPFGQLQAIHWLESGLDHVLEIAATQGQRHRMMRDPRHGPNGQRTLEALAAAIRDAAARAGHAPPAVSPGLSWLNRGPGILFLVILLILACLIAGIAAMALLEGASPGQGRGYQGAAVALLLPFGAGFLLLKTLRRRRRVLAAGDQARR